jgi:site-specific recombinase XerD
MPQAPVRRRRATREAISGDRVGARRATIVHAPVRRNVPWEDAATDFLRDKKGEGRSGATLELYESYLSDSRIAAWRTDHGIEDIGDVTAESLKALRDELIGAGLSLQGGVSGRLRVMRNFLRWCRRNGYEADPDAGDVHPPQVKWENIEPATISKLQERTLYQAARSDRDRFLLRFMINTGLRVSEVVGITLQSIEEIDLPDGTRERILRVRQGKGRKDRHVPLNTRAFPRFDREIADYVRAVRGTSARCPALFLTPADRVAEPTAYRPLTSSAIQSLFGRLALDTGIRIHPHMCRHTMASRWISSGVPPSVVKRALGHSSMRMVERYVHFDAAGLAAAARE